MSNVLYEEAGELKVGAVLAEQPASLQVEAPHGKRTKVKSAQVLLRFDTPPLNAFLAEAEERADEIDADFLWQCCGAEAFDYGALAREYYGHEPAAVEAAAVLMRLHRAPMYFYKRGRGMYRAAPADALAAALAGAERKRRQAEEKACYVAALRAGRLPAAFEPIVDELLYAPDKGSIAWKALDEASAEARLSPARLLARCGALSSPHDYHLRRFLHTHFPRGTDFPPLPPAPAPQDLPLAASPAFSIDDAATTEIDDAFSVATLPAGAGWRIGIHIAAPALGIPPGSEVDRAALARLSTVYYPGGKITMLPQEVIETFSLAAGRDCPALSLYADVAPDHTITAEVTCVERVRIDANLRIDALEPVFNERTIAGGHIDHPHGEALKVLFAVAARLEAARRGPEPPGDLRPEFVIGVSGDRVTITRRERGTPIDKVVSELMIRANSVWARQLAETGIAAIFRVQSNGKVRMSTVPGEHAGLNVREYVWASSPLRRCVDLINQRQLAALAAGDPVPYDAGDERLIGAMRDFESAAESYGEFQRTMERYWSLAWLVQEQCSGVTGTVIRDNLVRFEAAPLVVRVPSLPPLAPGTIVMLDVSEIDLFDLSLKCVYQGEAAPALAGAGPGSCHEPKLKI